MYCFDFSDAEEMIALFTEHVFGRSLLNIHGVKTGSFRDKLLLAFAESGAAERASQGCEYIEASIDAIGKELFADAEFIADSDPAAESKNTVIFSYISFFAIVAYRLAHIIYMCGAGFAARVVSEYAHFVSGVDIHPGAEIFSPFSIDHGTGVVIGETAVIGKFVKIYQGVTIGALNFPKDSEGRVIKGRKRHPTILDGAVIYTDAVVLGGDTVIGRNSVIGSRALVTSSIPDGAKVR